MGRLFSHGTNFYDFWVYLSLQHYILLFQGLYSILSQDLISLWESLYDLTDTYTERWLSSGRVFSYCDDLSEFLDQRECINFIVFSTGLISVSSCPQRRTSSFELLFLKPSSSFLEHMDILPKSCFYSIQLGPAWSSVQARKEI